MRTQSEVDAFQAEQDVRLPPERAAYESFMYEACVPAEFWFTTSKDVRHNVGPFQQYVMAYRKRLDVAYEDGYSMLFTGDNGVGKTMFMSYILGRAVNAGYSAYYTTLKRLDANIKRGFDDRDAGRRLRQQLSADFVAIDELGKEHGKTEFLVSELEELMKHRYDDKYPMLFASNTDLSALRKLYGKTVASMLEGRCTNVVLQRGDFRPKSKTKMDKRMGY